MALSKARLRATAGVVIVAALAGLAIGSRSTRASLSAAWIAFKDPSRVRMGDAEPFMPAPAPIELPPAEIGSDFDPVGDIDIADAGALPSFVQPDLQIPITQRTMRFVAYFASDEKGRRAFAER